MKAVLILSFQKEANARAVAVVTNCIHGIQKMNGFVLTERSVITMTDEQRVLLIGIFLAVFFTFAITAYFCLE